MNNHASDEISFRLLDELAKEPLITQRALAARLEIALGLVNAYLKKLYKKGYLKIKNLPRNRIKYILTPHGLSEKARLTYNYIHRSINYLREVRQRIDSTYASMEKSGVKNVLLWGDNEVAELCYISTRGLPIKIVGIIDNQKKDSGFFGLRIYSVEDIKSIDWDAILISSISDDAVGSIKQLNIIPEKIYYLE